MGKLSELQTNTMKYPFGRCRTCGKEFNSEMRNEYRIVHCPWCGLVIDDFMAEPGNENDLFCDDCGHFIYQATADGEGGDWTDAYAGVCGDVCGKELCGKCGGWYPTTGMCRNCQEKSMERDVDGSYRA